MPKPATVALPGEARPKNCFKPLETRRIQWDGKWFLLDEATGKHITQGETLHADQDGSYYGCFESQETLARFLTEYNAKNKKNLTGNIVTIAASDAMALVAAARKEQKDKKDRGSEGAGSDGLTAASKKRTPPTLMTFAAQFHAPNSAGEIKVDEFDRASISLAGAMSAIKNADPATKEADGINFDNIIYGVMHFDGPHFTTKTGQTKKSNIVIVVPRKGPDGTDDPETLKATLFKYATSGAVVMTDSAEALASVFPPVVPIVKRKADKALDAARLKEEKRKQAPAKKRKAVDVGLSDHVPLHVSSAQNPDDDDGQDMPVIE